MGFIFGGDTGQTQESITDARKRMALAMIQQGADTSPIQSPWQGVARLSEALMGGLALRRQEGQQQAADAQALAIATGQPYTPPAQPTGFLSSLFGGSKVPASSAQSEVAASSPSAAPAASAPNLDGNQVYSGFMDTVKGGVNNPYALAAIASTGKAESGFSPENAGRTWNDGVNNAGGIMSWNGPRLAALQRFAGGGNGTPQQQAQFFLQENPQLIASLNSAKSVGEAQQLMNNAWAFKGYNEPGNPNAAHRLAVAQSFLPQFAQAGAPAAPTQVASLDPGVGIPAPGAQGQIAATAPYRDPMVTTAYRQPQAPMPAAAAIDQQAPQPDPVQTASLGPTAAPQMQPPVNVAANPVPPQGPLPSPQPQAPADGPTRLAQAMQAAPQQPNALASPKAQALLRAMMNPNVSPQARQMVGAVLQQEMSRGQAVYQAQMEQYLKQQDPTYQLGLRKDQIELDHLEHPENVTPESVRALNLRAQQAGLQPGTPAYQQFMISGGNVQRNEAPPPAGYRNVRDDQGNLVSIEPIPGSPAATAQQTKQDAKDISTDVVTSAAQHAREAAMAPGTLPATGTGSGLAANFANTNAAEVRRQVDVMKANASLDNLTAMRAASPTGGALGSVTEGEEKLLANKIGIIDPSSPHFLRDLDAAEKTQLEIIHGKEAGDKIWLDANPRRYPNAPKIGTVEDGHRYIGGNPAEPDSWELQN